MNRLFVFALAIALSAGAATSIFTASDDHGVLSLAAQQNSAAFRDGMYLGKLDLENHRKPHLIASRWTDQADRTAFLAGYESAYGNVINAYGVNTAADSKAEIMGFHDGISDGLQHRQAAKQFQVIKTENYRRADRGLTMGPVNAGNYQQNYRAAYVNGYQQAFYGQQNEGAREVSQQTSF
jgi:hypothetical protein